MLDSSRPTELFGMLSSCEVSVTVNSCRSELNSRRTDIAFSRVDIEYNPDCPTMWDRRPVYWEYPQREAECLSRGQKVQGHAKQPKMGLLGRSERCTTSKTVAWINLLRFLHRPCSSQQTWRQSECDNESRISREQRGCTSQFVPGGD
jgi:hypothetical protein